MRHAPAWRFAAARLRAGEAVALLTITEVRGSAPREVGASLAVDPKHTAGTIGGGHLEHSSIEQARALLRAGDAWRHERVGLGPKLGQCCGGRVGVLIERLDSSDLDWLDAALSGADERQLLTRCHANTRRKQLLTGGDKTTRCSHQQGALELQHPAHPGHFHLQLFGAGHVASALVPLLQTLPCSLHWIDSREDYAPVGDPPWLRGEWLETPTLALADAPADTMALVMTHEHQLDFEITAAALHTPQIQWVGLIGSSGKRRSFERRYPDCGNNRLHCPIGSRDAGLRAPSELAIVIAGELLRARAPLTVSNTLESQNA